MIIHEDKDSVAHLYGDCKGEDGVIAVKTSSKYNYKDDEILEYKILSNGRLALSCVSYYTETGYCETIVLEEQAGEDFKYYKFYKTIGEKLADLLKTKKRRN